MHRFRLGFLAALVGLALALAAPAAGAPNGYSTDAAGNAQTIDLATAAVTQIGAANPNIGLNEVALSPAGVLYTVGTTTDLLYTVDLTTGLLTPLPNPLGVDVSNPGMTFSADGRLWMVNNTTLYRVDPATGVATAIGTGLDFMSGLAAGCDSGLYAVRTDQTPNVFLVRITDLDGTPTFTDVGTGLGFAGGDINSPKIAFAADGTLWGKMANFLNRTFTIAPATGVGTFVSAVNAVNSNGLTIAAPSCAAPVVAPDDGPRFVG